ncbi:hypothetical protein O6P37_19870 [Mycobacterium sp. CPCC 205372]|uniref:Uncharacterized protein n=1 Tax=Mycobacterium hippophais TaxID=3016340 RepID=A0ABT4PX58_9MYCO|nr:hypothetical protein [Mycobacterium hippophais]MCZ8381131.1 hypothetical protein [Mycobacterium hippophais]
MVPEIGEWYSAGAVPCEMYRKLADLGCSGSRPRSGTAGRVSSPTNMTPCSTRRLPSPGTVSGAATSTSSYACLTLWHQRGHEDHPGKDLGL